LEPVRFDCAEMTSEVKRRSDKLNNLKELDLILIEKVFKITANV